MRSRSCHRPQLGECHVSRSCSAEWGWEPQCRKRVRAVFFIVWGTTPCVLEMFVNRHHVRAVLRRLFPTTACRVLATTDTFFLTPPVMSASCCLRLGELSRRPWRPCGCVLAAVFPPLIEQAWARAGPGPGGARGSHTTDDRPRPVSVLCGITHLAKPLVTLLSSVFRNGCPQLRTAERDGAVLQAARSPENASSRRRRRFCSEALLRRLVHVWSLRAPPLCPPLRCSDGGGASLA